MSSNTKKRVLKSIKEIRVLNDPYRQEIMSRMNLIGRPATAKEIATEMKEAPSKVNYHLKVLEEYNFVEIDHTENINGIIAKYYKRTVTEFDVKFDDDEYDTLKENAVISMMQSFFNNARDKHVSRLRKINQNCEDDSLIDKGLVSSTKFYLNKEDLKELNELITKFASNDKEGRKLYNMFMSYTKEED